MRSEKLQFPASGPAETARNRLLRRVDWRFLLPRAAQDRAVCLAPALLEGTRAVAAVVDDEVAVSGGYDLAVAQDPPRSLSECAFAALRPGGTYYSEWLSPRLGRTARIDRELRAIGFEDVAVYAFWPWATSLRLPAWVPLESPAALRYFFATRPRSPELTTRVLYALLRATWRTLLRAGLPPVAVIARRPAGASATAADDLGAFIRGAWEGWGLGARPRRLSWMLLTGGPRAISKPVALVFANGDPAPRVAVKFARVPESSPAIRNEAAVLRTLAADGVPSEGAPRVLFAHDAAVGETVIEGEALTTALRWSNADELAAAGAEWLCGLAAGATPVDREAWWERLVAAPTREFARLYAQAVSDRELDAAERRVAALGRLPLICEHRDFSPWNVLRGRDGRLRVLDWESAEPCGLPVRDLTYFLAYCGFFLDGAMESGRYVETYRRLLDPSTQLGALVARHMRAYCDALRLPDEAVAPLRLLTWMVHAFSEHRSLSADVGGTPTAESLRSGLFLALWREELHADA